MRTFWGKLSGMANRDLRQELPRSWTRGLVLALLLLGCTTAGCPRALRRSESAAALSAYGLPTLDGEYFNFGTHRDEVLVVTFFATWCMPCLAEIPYLKELDRRPGLRVVAVSVDRGGVRVLAPFVGHFEITYPILLGDASLLEGRSPFGKIPAIPATFLLTRSRRVFAAQLGGIGPGNFDPLVAKARKAR